MVDDDNFLSRWSRRKAVVQSGKLAPAEPPEPPEPPERPERPERVEPPGSVADAPFVVPAAAPPARVPDAVPPPQPAPLTLADVARLTRDSDYSAFVARSVSPDVRNAALKQLFTDPHYNIMDGLDTYIADYGIPDPLPAGMLRQMTQTAFLRLFDDDPEAEAPAAQLAQSTVIGTATADTLPTESDTYADTATDTVFEPDVTEHSAAHTAITPHPPAPAPAPHEDPDLRLQPDDAARRGGPRAGTDEDPGRQR